MKSTTLAKTVLFVLGLSLFGSAQAYHFPWDQGHDTTTPNEPDNNDDEPPNDCNSQGSPVYLKTGQFIWTEQDVALPGMPMLKFSRTYYSKDPRDGGLGKGWHGSCEATLLSTADMQRIASADPQTPDTLQPVTKYVMRLGSGRRYEFTETNGVITKPNGLYDYDIVKRSNGALRLTQKNGAYKEYDRAGKLTSEADRNGNITNYTYSNDRLTRIADTNGRFLALTYNASGRVESVTDHTSRSWQYQYNADGTLASVTDPLGSSRNYEYTTYKKTGDGQTYYDLTRITDETGKVVTQVTYSNGMVTSYTEGANTFTYTRSGTQVTKRDSMSASWVFTLNTAGLYTSVRDPNGLTELFEYNADQQITKYTDRAGTVTTNTYDAQNRLTQSVRDVATTTWTYSGNNTWPSSTTSPIGNMWQFQHDTRGNLTAVTDPAGNVTGFTWSTKGELTRIAMPDGSASTIVYNGVALPTTFTDPLNRVARYTYDAAGNRVSVTNPAGEVTNYQYDALNRMTRHTDPLGSITEYAYDDAGRIASITTANGEQVGYAYDAYGRKTTYTHFDGTQETFAYRADNLLQSMTNPAAQTTQYTYDAGKRMTRQTLPDDTINYTYNARGQITQASNNTGTITRTYDTRGRLSLEVVNGETLTYTYDAEDRMTGMTALGETLGVTYDARGLMQRMTSGAGSIDYQHDVNGRLAQIARPNGINSVYGYDVAGQLTSIDNAGLANGQFQYQYDAAGRVTDWQDRGTQKQFDYDTVGRLTQASYGSETEAFSYDAMGNRTSANAQFDAANRLLEDDDFTYQYDVKGNRISKLGKSDGTYETYTYSARNQLTRYRKFAAQSDTTPQVDVTYGYDAYGRRWYKQIANGARTDFVWRGSRLLAEKSPSKVQAYFGDLLKEGSQYYFRHQDHSQTAQIISDATGQSVWSLDKSSFGVTNSASGSITFNSRFPGQYFDAESGLHDNYFRTYDPNIGRYLQSDPIGLDGGLNTYAYVYANPLSYVDPDGLYANVAIGVGIRVIGGRALAGAIGAAARRYGPASVIAACVLAGVCSFQEESPTEGEAPGQCPTPENPSWPGDDPTQAPPGTEWRGAPGSTPGDGRGNYHNPETGESYRPDLDHPEPVGPHWDYHGPNGETGRFYPDGSYVPK